MSRLSPSGPAKGLGSIVVVDDDPDSGATLQAYLHPRGYAVDVVTSGRMLDDLLASGHVIDVLILDILLPGESGLSICRRLARRQPFAIILHSALGAEDDRIVGLEVGADAYLPKPTSPRELLAHINAMMRRQRDALPPLTPSYLSYSFAGWEFRPLHRVLVRPDDLHIPLSKREAMLLRVFLEQPQVILSREAIARATDLSQAVDVRLVDSHVRRLRQRIGDQADTLIRSHYGVGYSFLPTVMRVRAGA